MQGGCICTLQQGHGCVLVHSYKQQEKSPGRAGRGRALTLGLACGRGLLGTSVLDERVVLVVGAALLAHLHHLHLRQRCVPLHHVLGPQGRQAADLQLAPARDRGHGPGEPAAPAPGSARSRSSARQLSQAPRSPAQPSAKPSRWSGQRGRRKHWGTQASPRGARPPRASEPLPVVGRPEEKDKKGHYCY